MWTETRDGAFGGGTYQYNAPNGISAQLTLATGTLETVLTLAFSSVNAGTYTYTAGASGQGNFMVQAAQPNNENPDSGGDGGSGLAPSSLSGRTMLGTRTFTSTGPMGQTHVYTFAGNTFHDSDPPEESDGSFAYEADGDHATLTLAYYAPENFNGDRHEIRMTFHTEESGVFESMYTRQDGTLIRINGTFDLQ
jgi:hypothetical protein